MKNNSTFDQIKYQNEYNKENYDRVFINLPKGMKNKVKTKAAIKGKSLSAYQYESFTERAKELGISIKRERIQTIEQIQVDQDERTDI